MASYLFILCQLLLHFFSCSNGCSKLLKESRIELNIFSSNTLLPGQKKNQTRRPILGRSGQTSEREMSRPPATTIAALMSRTCVVWWTNRSSRRPSTRPTGIKGEIYFTYDVTITLGSRYPAVLVNRLYSLSGVNGRITSTDQFACNVLVIRPIRRRDNEYSRITSTAG